MLAKKLCAVKEAVLTAQRAVSEMFAPLPLSNKISSSLSEALDFITNSIDEPSPETRLLLIYLTLTKVYRVIKYLAQSTNLNIRGVLVKSTLKDLNKVAAAVKMAQTFAMMSPNDQDPMKLNYIKFSCRFADICVNLISKHFKENEKQTIVELSNALKITCSVIKCSAANVVLNYAWCDDCICEGNTNANKCKH